MATVRRALFRLPEIILNLLIQQAEKEHFGQAVDKRQQKQKKGLQPVAKISRNPLLFRGGDDGIRTHDPYLAKVMLSQLSYIPTGFKFVSGET